MTEIIILMIVVFTQATTMVCTYVLLNMADCFIRVYYNNSTHYNTISFKLDKFLEFSGNH